VNSLNKSKLTIGLVALLMCTLGLASATLFKLNTSHQERNQNVLRTLFSMSGNVCVYQSMPDIPRVDQLGNVISQP
jgi:hypothetical protein